MQITIILYILLIFKNTNKIPLLQSRSDFTIRRQLVQDILQQKGQALVIRVLHAAVYSLSSYMMSDIADVLVEVSLISKEVNFQILNTKYLICRNSNIKYK